MWKIALKNLAANKVRLALTALAIVLGVGFVSSANILSDGLRDSFGSLAAEIVQGTDLEVDREANEDLNVAEVERINAVDGVRLAIGQHTSDRVFPIRADGTLVLADGPPVFAFGWNLDDQLNPSTLETGRAPVGGREWIVDISTAERDGFVVGESYDIVIPSGDGTLNAELVGTFRFGEDNQVNGAALLGFDGEVAAELFDRQNFSEIVIAIDGSRPVADVQADLEAEFGEGYIVSDTADLNAQTTAEFNEFINIFAWVLRSFAIVALFVSIFIIANTFNIVMSQRVRELGLLRAIGATPTQVRRAVLGEAFIIGVLASILGIFVGLGLAYGVEGALNGIGAELPDFDKSISVATALIALAVGIVVTMLSAWVPARRAGRITPVTAISGIDDSTASGRRSTILGGALVVIGAALTGVALFGGIESTATLLAMLGGGAAVLLVGITLVSSLVAAPISRALGAPIAKIYRRPGFLAKENAARNPKRTATTAAALMIGLSLVSMAFVVGQSLKSDLNELLETTVTADYAAFPATRGVISPAAVTELEASPELSNVTGLRYWDTTVNDLEDTEVGNVSFDQIDAVFDLGLVEGSYTNIGDDGTAIRESLATDLGLSLGDTVTAELNDGSTQDLVIEAIFTNGEIFSGIIVNDARFDTIGDQAEFDWVAFTAAGDTTAADAAVASVAEEFPQVLVQSALEFREEVTGQVDMLLSVLTGFLGLAIVIAFIGIVNTMALSIFERTRELGLLRAVGMTRGQVHRMVRWEAAIVSSVGALFGAVVGVIFGVLVVIATPDEVLSNLAIPWIPLIAIVVVAGLVGLVAGFLPARRAGKLNVLDAISH